jgi:hypothetical protein
LDPDGIVVEGTGAPESSACAIHLGLRKLTCLGLDPDGIVVEGTGAPESSACAIHLGLRKLRPSAR